MAEIETTAGVAAAFTALLGLFAKWKFATKGDLKDMETRIMAAIGEDRRRLDKGDDTLLTLERHSDICGRNTAELRLFLVDQFACLRREMKENGWHQKE